MKIDWSRVPRGTAIKHVGRGFSGEFLEYVEDTNSVGITMIDGVYYADARNITFLNPRDHAKYSVLDPQETRDIKNCDRILEDALYGLFSIRDIMDARLRGETIQYRPFTEHDAWMVATEQHVPDLDAYQYRVIPNGCRAWRGEEKRDKIEAKEDRIVEQRRDEISDEVAARQERCVESSYKQLIANEVEAGLVDEAVKDRAMKMIISGTMKMEDEGIPPDTMDRLMPSALEFFKKAILQGHFDEEAVARFNDLVKEGKIVYRSPGSGREYPCAIDSYCLRPAPRYRAFDPDKDDFTLSDFCEKQIHCGDDLAVIDSVNCRGVNARFYKKSGDGPPKIILITWEDLVESWRDENENPVGAET